jgi:hypothetical protein
MGAKIKGFTGPPLPEIDHFGGKAGDFPLRKLPSGLVFPRVFLQK